MSSNSIPEISIGLSPSFTIEEINAPPCKDAFTAFKQNLLSSSEALQLIQQCEMRRGIGMGREQSALTLTISRARVFGDVDTVPYPVGIKSPPCAGTTILVYVSLGTYVVLHCTILIAVVLLPLQLRS